MENYFLCLNSPPVPQFFRSKLKYSRVSKSEFYRIINLLSNYYPIQKVSESGNKLTYNCIMYDTKGRNCGLWEIGYKELSDPE